MGGGGKKGGCLQKEKKVRRVIGATGALSGREREEKLDALIAPSDEKKKEGGKGGEGLICHKETHLIISGSPSKVAATGKGKKTSIYKSQKGREDFSEEEIGGVAALLAAGSRRGDHWGEKRKKET